MASAEPQKREREREAYSERDSKRCERQELKLMKANASGKIAIILPAISMIGDRVTNPGTSCAEGQTEAAKPTKPGFLLLGTAARWHFG